MPLTTWELWAQHEDGKVTIYAFGPKPVDLMIEDGDWTLLWTVEASSYNDAMCKKHEYLGWEPYRPMPGTE